MEPKETVVTNCLIVPRKGDVVLFAVTPEHGVQCCLDGYAILPIETYRELTQRQSVPVHPGVQ